MQSGQDIEQRIAAIHDALEGVKVQLASYESAAKHFHGSDRLEDKANLTVAHNALVVDATRLLQTVRGPMDALFEYSEKVSIRGTIPWSKNWLLMQIHLGRASRRH